MYSSPSPCTVGVICTPDSIPQTGRHRPGRRMGERKGREVLSGWRGVVRRVQLGE